MKTKMRLSTWLIILLVAAVGGILIWTVNPFIHLRTTENKLTASLAIAGLCLLILLCDDLFVRLWRWLVPGLNEGLAILEALISHQWGTLWPQPVHTRMEILSGLSQRLQQLMRTLSLNYSDLSQLYQAEQQLTALGEVLQRLELKHLSQLDTLRTLMHNSAVRLENSHDASEPGVVIQHPSVATGTFNHAAPESPVTAKTDPLS